MLTSDHYGYGGRHRAEDHDCHEFPGFRGRSCVLRDRPRRRLLVFHGWHSGRRSPLGTLQCSCQLSMWNVGTRWRDFCCSLTSFVAASTTTSSTSATSCTVRLWLDRRFFGRIALARPCTGLLSYLGRFRCLPVGILIRIIAWKKWSKSGGKRRTGCWYRVARRGSGNARQLSEMERRVAEL